MNFQQFPGQRDSFPKQTRKTPRYASSRLDSSPNDFMKADLNKIFLLCLCIPLLTGISGCSKEAKRDRYLRQAETHFTAGDYERARIEFLNVLQIERTNSPAIQKLGLILYDQGLVQKSAPYLAAARQMAPANVDARIRFAYVYLAAGQRDNARREATEIAKLRPGFEDAILLLAETATKPEEIQETQRLIQTLRQSSGEKAVYLVAQAVFLFRQKDLAGVEKSLKQALSLDSKSVGAHSALASVHLAGTNLALAGDEFKAAADLAPSRSGHQLRYADFLLRSGAPEKGTKFLEDLTGKTPDFIPAWVALAQVYFNPQKYDDCARVVDRVLAVDPSNYGARMLHARLALARNEPAKAVAELEKLAVEFPKSADLRYQLGLASLLDKDASKAEANLGQAVTLAPDFAEAVFILAQLNLNKGRFDSVITSLTQLLKNRPDAGRAYPLLAQAYLSTDQSRNALAVLQSFQKAFPNDPQGPFQIGLVLMQQSRTNEARAAFEQALKLQPAYLPAAAKLIEQDLTARNSQIALQRALGQVSLATNSPVARTLLGEVYLALKDEKQAEIELRRAIQIDPSFRDPYMLLARIYVGGKQLQPALDQLSELLQRKTNDIGALMLFGVLNAEQKNYGKARDAYEKLLKVKPDSTAAINNLAYLYSEHLKDLDKALEYGRKARRLLPNDPAIADTLGWTLFRQGEYGESVALLRESSLRLSSVPEIQYHLGMAYYMMAQEAPARSALENALKSANDFPGKEEAARKLALLNAASKPGNTNLKSALEDLVRKEPNDVFALTRLGTIYVMDGTLDKAAGAYEQALKQNTNAFLPTIKLAEIYAGRPQERAKALLLAKRAREMVPGDAQAAQNLGRLAFQAGDHAWAFSLFQESARQRVDEPSLLSDLAMASYSLGRLSEAEQYLQQTLASKSPFPQAESAKQFLTMLSLYRNPAAALAAVTRVEDVLKRQPDDVPALMVSGVIFEQRQKYVEARKAYEAALARYPQFVEARRALAILLADRVGDIEKANEYASKAREVLPNDPGLMKLVGKLAYKRGDFRYAIQLCKDGLRLQAADPELQFYLGMSQFQSKLPNDAKMALQQALKLELKEPEAKEARDTLARIK